MNSFLWTFSWLFMIAGVLLIIAGLVSQAYQQDKERYKGRATATVVEIVADMPDDEGLARGIHDYYYPVFAYYAGGRLFKVRYPGGGNPCPYSMNQKVEIQYNTENPSLFKIQEKTQLNKLSNFLYRMGFLCCIGGGVLFVLFAMRIFSNRG